MTPEKRPVSINVPLDAKPSFSNATQVMVSDDSVIIQFAFVRPHATSGQIISELVLSPKHAIQFNRALDSTIKKHFTRHLEADRDDKPSGE